VTAPGKTWPAVDVVVQARGREATEYGLSEAGAIGTETRDVDGGYLLVKGYFDKPVEPDHLRRLLENSLRVYSHPPSVIIELKTSEVPDRDWLAEWKRDWQPVEVGKRFIVAPPWSEINDAGDRIVIRIEPGMAFGTGTHETTRLCLKAIEKHFRDGSFLDVGTGTGILAIAAAKSFPEAQVEACDTDADAIEIARENARLNEVADRIVFRAGAINEQTRSVDFVCANLTAEVIVEILPALLNATCGRLVLSGILVEQIEMIRNRLAELGVTSRSEFETDGEWAAVVI